MAISHFLLWDRCSYQNINKPMEPINMNCKLSCITALFGEKNPGELRFLPPISIFHGHCVEVEQSLVNYHGTNYQ